MCDLKIFSVVCHSPAHRFIDQFFPNFNQGQLTKFFLPRVMLLAFYRSTVLLTEDHKDFLLLFFVFHFIFRSLVHFELVFCVRWEIRVKNKPPEKLAGECPRVTALLVEKQFLPLLNCLCMFASSQLIVFTWGYFWFLYPFHWSVYLCFHWYLTLLFIIRLKIRS